MRFRNAASAYGSAFRTTRPFDTLIRISPPTLVSRISRAKFRYSRDREFGGAPWNGMKINCATSSRNVIPLIQRRTVDDALAAADGFGELGLRRDAGAAADRHAAVTAKTRKGRGTLSVCQISAAQHLGPRGSALLTGGGLAR